MVEYVLFGLGVAIIIISLIITYRQNNNGNQDDYYLQSELLSEIRTIKTELNSRLDKLEKNDFHKVLDQKLEENPDRDFTTAINDIQDGIIKLEEKIDRLESKMNYSLSNTVSSNSSPDLNADNSENKETTQEHQNYQDIKELVEDGLSLPEVAQKLDMGTREVRLIWKFNARGEE